MTRKKTDKVVLRFKDGRTLKGYVEDFSVDSKTVALEEAEKKTRSDISIGELKAIFFVRSFEGDRRYRERKSYGLPPAKGKRIYVRFADNESIIGFAEGELPWKKGFYISKKDEEKTGFFVRPVDEGSNNIRIYIIISAIKDIALIGA